MMIGPLINSGAIVLGGLSGALLARVIPHRLQQGLPATFAQASTAIGINMIIKVHYLPVMVMSLILGTALGELFYLEKSVSRAASALQRRCQRWLPLPRGHDQESFSQ